MNFSDVDIYITDLINFINDCKQDYQERYIKFIELKGICKLFAKYAPQWMTYEKRDGINARIKNLAIEVKV